MTKKKNKKKMLLTNKDIEALVNFWDDQSFKCLAKNYYQDAATYGTSIAEFHPVDRPVHYNKAGIECIQAIEASMTREEFEGALKANVIKYIWRYKYKNGMEDLKKAQWYLDKLIETNGKPNGRETQAS